MRVPGTPSKCVFIACLQCKLHAYVSALICLQCEGLRIGNSILSKSSLPMDTYWDSCAS